MNFRVQFAESLREVAFAVSQPEEVDVNEILFRLTGQQLQISADRDADQELRPCHGRRQVICSPRAGGPGLPGGLVRVEPFLDHLADLAAFEVDAAIRPPMVSLSILNARIAS